MLRRKGRKPVPSLLVRPPERDTKPTTEGHSLSAPEILGHERGAGVALLAVPGSENDAVELEHASADAPAESGSDTTVGAPTWGSTYD